LPNAWKEEKHRNLFSSNASRPFQTIPRYAAKNLQQQQQNDLLKAPENCLHLLSPDGSEWRKQSRFENHSGWLEETESQQRKNQVLVLLPQFGFPVTFRLLKSAS
jgi:beta-lactamase class A